MLNVKNAYFILKKISDEIEIEKFHICSWEYKNESASIEFGAELDLQNFSDSKLELKLFIPWLKESTSIEDLYTRLKDSSNSKFIFNDIIECTDSLDGGNNKNGVIHRFKGREPLYILPVELVREENFLNITLNTAVIREKNKPSKVYFRLLLHAPPASLSIRKTGIGRSTIVYDFKINERRNAPNNWGRIGIFVKLRQFIVLILFQITMSLPFLIRLR